MPKRIQRSRAKGWRMPEGAVYVGRPTKWGNPFTTSQNTGSRSQPEYWTAEKCVALFRFTMCATDRAGVFTDFEMNEVDLNPLRGKDLACWCPLDQPCHADVLLEMANASNQGDSHRA